MKKSHRLIKMGDALSQLCNVTLLSRHNETNANESISGRAYRCGWKKTEKVINWLFLPFEQDHCKRAFENDLLRAKELITEHPQKSPQ